MYTASILEFPSKEIQGKSSVGFQIHRRFPGLGKVAGLGICRFSWVRKSNNSGSGMVWTFTHHSPRNVSRAVTNLAETGMNLNGNSFEQENV